jgi:type IV secretory pathway VirJ component
MNGGQAISPVRTGRIACPPLLALLLAACASITAPGVVPTIELDARGSAQSPYFVAFVTGDGGWRKIDVKVSDVLRDAGMPVVGLLANKYFLRDRTPQETGRDLDQLIREYQTKWQRQQVILIGFSRGAEALPFMINHASDDTRRSIALIVLLGPAETTGFVIHTPDRLSVLPEVRKLKGIPLLCVNGTREKHSVCRSLRPTEATVFTLNGGHHFGGHYGGIGHAILDALRQRG